MHLCILTALHHWPKDWILPAKHSSSVYWHIKIKHRVLSSYIDILPLVFLCLHQGPLWWNGHWFPCLHQGPIRWNGHWFSCLHQGPLRWNGHWFPCLHQGPLWWNGHWFSCLHQGPLRWNGHWFSYVYIKALSDEMVIDFLMFHIKALSDGMVIDFLMFHIKALSDEMVIDFLISHQGPLRWNGHWFSFFTSRPSPMEWSFVSFFTSRPSPMEWPLISLSQQDPLLRNGRVCFLLWITTLFFDSVIVYAWFVFPLFLWNPNEISVFIFTHLLLW